MTDSTYDKNREPVAIIGLSCLFPGAGDINQYWELIRSGADALADVPEDHWSLSDYYDQDPKARDKTYGRRGGFLAPVSFSPMRYGISPKDLPAIDSTQLLALVAADRALRDAGYPHDGAYGHQRTAVFLGVTGALKMVATLGGRLAHPQARRAMEAVGLPEETIARVLDNFSQEFPQWQENTFPGLLGNVTAGRVANRLNLGGANMVLDAACASSLAAVYQAAQELRSGRADLVISGGADTFSDPFMYTCFSKTPALSPTGEIKAYDRRGDGTMLGEGLGLVVLKRLSDAERDGDRVYAVIKGFGASSDGKGAAVFAPSAAGQARAISQAFEEAGFPPSAVELVEGHGTGTAVGDSVEVEALREVFSRENGASAKEPWCALGSVKSQIGHTKAAAGAAGLIKAVLALYYKVLPPSIKAGEPLEPLSDPQCPIYLNGEPRPWLSPFGRKRRAGVSAFGFGGSNYHCLLEEASPLKARAESSQSLWAFSAPSLKTLLGKLEEVQAGPEGEAGAAFISRLARASLSAFDWRDDFRLVLAGELSDLPLLAAVAQKELAGKGLAASLPEGACFGHEHPEQAFGLIAPQSSRPGLFRELALERPEFLKALDDFSHGLIEDDFSSPSLSRLFYPPSSASGRKPDFSAGPDLLKSLSRGLCEVLASFGLKAEETVEPWNMSADELAKGGWLAGLKSWVSFSEDLEEPLSGILKNKVRLFSGRDGLAGLLARLAAFGFPVDLSSWPTPIFEEEKADEFSVSISGANYFVKGEYPHQKAPGAAAFPPERAAASLGLGAELAETLERMAAEIARLRRDLLERQGEVLSFLEKGFDLKAEKASIPAEALLKKEGPGMSLPSSPPENQIPPEADDKFGEIMGIVARETGYPREMLKRDMDLESDLGLDSIKRVEIMAAVSERWPSLDMDGRDFSSARTLGQLSDLAQAPEGGDSFRPPKAKPAAPAVFSPERPSGETSQTDLWGVLKSVVARETGYPEAMLRRDMDLENDLGLDSIKKVEILAALAEELPQAEDISGLYGRTMEDLYNGLAKAVASAAAVAPSREEVPAQAAPAKFAPSSSPSFQTVCEVVAEETGYPLDMLKPEMRLEEDLGLDSIKKVEILAALAERFPGLENMAANASDLATLADLSALPLQMGNGSQAAPSANSESAFPENVKRLVCQVISQETGFPLEMLGEESLLEEDLGLDSIKRVEIMAALSEALDEEIGEKGLDVNQAASIGDLCGLLAGAVGFSGSVEEKAPYPPAFKAANGKASSNGLDSKGPAKNLPLSSWRLMAEPLALDSLKEVPEILAPDSRVWVVGSGALAANLVAALEQKGLRCLSLGWDDEEGLEKLPRPDSLIIIWPGGNDDSGLPLKAFRIIRKAAPHFEQNLEKGRRCLLMGITFMGGAFALPSTATRKSTPINPVSASLAGLIKSAALEWPQVVGRVVDLPLSAYGLESHDYVSGLIKAARVEAPLEISSPRPEVFYRLTILKHEIGGNNRPINPGDVVVVTGGGRGVTAQVALELAQELKPHLVILGRSLLGEEEPAWLASLSGEADIRKALYEKAKGAISPAELAQESRKILNERELRGNLKMYEALGAKVSYISGDMRDIGAFRKTLSDVSREFGPIKGFIHGAGVLQDSLIARKKDEEFNLVFDTKVRIALAALAQLKNEPISLLVFFSSSSARFGRKGQSDYAAGNEVLNKLAQVAQRRWPRAKVLSVNWGPWAGGMVNPALAKTFAQEGIGLIPMVEGGQLLSRLVTEPYGTAQEILVFGPGTDLGALGII